MHPNQARIHNFATAQAKVDSSRRPPVVVRVETMQELKATPRNPEATPTPPHSHPRNLRALARARAGSASMLLELLGQEYVTFTNIHVQTGALSSLHNYADVCSYLT